MNFDFSHWAIRLLVGNIRNKSKQFAAGNKESAAPTESVGIPPRRWMVVIPAATRPKIVCFPSKMKSVQNGS
jgi:hypothetical protein